MSKLDQEDFLAAWQVIWGHLDVEWHSIFLDDPLVAQIIWYDSEFIYPSLKKFRKLEDILTDIQENTIIEDPRMDAERREEFLAHLEERDAYLESRRNAQPPKREKVDPKELPPLEFEKVNVEDLWNQPDKRHWW
jgi:hypothetical protein